MSKFRAYWQLLRPPNLLTAVSDILAGVAIALGYQQLDIDVINFWQSTQGILTTAVGIQIVWLVLATLGLYGGGVVLNDYFDASLDAIERPERPIPSGKVPKSHAGILGFTLLILAIIAGFMASQISGVIAALIAFLVILYDTKSKKHALWGPINMGLCRGANLILGISIFSEIVVPMLFMAAIPIAYIAAITLVSRGEVHGGTKRNFNLAAAVYLLVVLMLLSLGMLHQYHGLYALPFLLLLVVMIVPPLLKARRSNQPQMIGLAVKAGVLALIPLNAALAAGFLGWIFGLLLLLLLPISMLLAKLFAVT